MTDVEYLEDQIYQLTRRLDFFADPDIYKCEADKALAKVAQNILSDTRERCGWRQGVPGIRCNLPSLHEGLPCEFDERN